MWDACRGRRGVPVGQRLSDARRRPGRRVRRHRAVLWSPSQALHARLCASGCLRGTTAI